jgi:hypothetical protein
MSGTGTHLDSLSDRVPAALAAHAQTFATSPDAWDRTRARAATIAAGSRRWPRGRHRGLLTRRGQLLMPIAAAAAVVAVVAAATVTVHGLSGTAAPRPGSATKTGATAQPTPDACSTSSGPLADLVSGQSLLSSASLCLKITDGTQRGFTYFQLGSDNPLNWPLYVAAGLQYCTVTVYTSAGSMSPATAETCGPLPRLGAGHLASVTVAQPMTMQAQPSVLAGFAANQATSVSAVLPGGRTYPGAISGGRGLPEKAWAVLAPDVTGARLVFRNAAGQEVASLAAPAQLGIPAVAQPRSGGGMIYSCHSCQVAVNAYPVAGHVGFWVTGEAGYGLISPAAASGEPALAGTWLELGRGPSETVVVGYAPKDATRVAVRLPDGTQYSAPTLPAPWSGSSVRLWVLVVPEYTWGDHLRGSRSLSVIARAYGTSGQIGAGVELGFPNG